MKKIYILEYVEKDRREIIYSCINHNELVGYVIINWDYLIKNIANESNIGWDMKNNIITRTITFRITDNKKFTIKKYDRI